MDYAETVRKKFTTPQEFEEVKYESLQPGDLLFDRLTLTAVTVVSKSRDLRASGERVEMVTYKVGFDNLVIEEHTCWFVQV